LGALLLAPCCAWAIDCPKQPEQAQKDWDVEVRTAVGKIGPVTGAELATRTRNVTHDLLGLLPQADKVYLEQMMYATYCSTLRDDPSLSEPQKSARIKAYNLEVRSALRAERGGSPQAPPGVSSQDAARSELARIPLPYTPDALIESAKNGDLRAVKLFLAAGMDPNGKNKDGTTALMSAAGKGHLEIVAALLEGHAGVNESNKSGATALNWAAAQGREDVVRLLLEHGVDRQAIRDAVEAAAQSGHLDVLRYLAKEGLDRTLVNQALISAAGSPLVGISEAGINGVVQFLLSLGADVDTPGEDSPEDGWTPLLMAVNLMSLNRERAEVVRTLLGAGAAVNAKCVCSGYQDGGWTALMIAALQGNKALLELLLGHGADPNLANSDGDTALTIAANTSTGAAESLLVLLDKGANINAKNNKGVTALMLAAAGGGGKVPLLLARGADPNARNVNGGTALMWAAGPYAHAENMAALLDAGADVQAKSNVGVTALMLAASSGRADLVETLLRRGARAREKDENDKTAVDYANDYVQQDASADGRKILGLLKKAGK
jgi:ankyrin repeat protein